MKTSVFLHNHRTLTTVLVVASIFFVVCFSYQNWVKSHSAKTVGETLIGFYREYSVYSYETTKDVTMYYGITLGGTKATPSQNSLEALEAWIDASSPIP